MPITAETFRLLRSQQQDLNKLISGLDGRIQRVWYSVRADLDAADWGSLTPKQRRNLNSALDSQFGRKLELIAADTARTARTAAAAAWADQEALTRSQLPKTANLQWRRPDPKAVAWMEERTKGQIESRSRRLSAKARQSVYAELNRGVARGTNPREVARLAQKRTAAVGDAIDGGIARSLNIARTEVLDAYRASAMLSQQANPESLAGWVWIAKLGARTCRSCWSMHGKQFKTSEPGPRDHPQGRCARMPKTKTWRELGFDIDEPADTTLLDATKAFQKLTVDQQKGILTDAGYDLWKSGKWPRQRWTTTRTPSDWRPYQAAAKVPDATVAPPKPPRPPRPPKPAPEPAKPSEVPRKTGEEPSRSTPSWLNDHATAKSRFNRRTADQTNATYKSPTTRGLYQRDTGTYRGSVDESGEMVPFYRDNLDAVMDAGEQVEKEWYRRVREKVGGPAQAEVDDAERLVRRYQKQIRAMDDQIADEWVKIERLRQAARPNKAAIAAREKTISDLQDAMNRVSKLNQEARTNYTKLELDRRKALGNAHGEISNPARAKALKTEGDLLKDVLNDLGLDLGHTQTKWLTASVPQSSRANVTKLMEESEKLYPKHWLDAVTRFRSSVQLKKAQRGYNAGDGRIIALSDTGTVRGIGNVNHVAIHELGHSMEAWVEGLAQMEWAFLYRRTSIVMEVGGKAKRVMPKQTAIYRGTTEKGWEDEFFLHYTGKSYDGSAWEVFTTGIESLWSGSGYLDADFRRWLLGVLTVL